MSQYGIHVPEGMPAKTVDEVVDAAEKMKDDAGEVSTSVFSFWHRLSNDGSVCKA